MTTKVSLDLDGFAEYLEALQQAAKDIDAVAGECLDSGGEVLVAGMQRRAPFERIRAVISKTGVYRDGDKQYLYLGVLRTVSAEDARIANVWEFGGRDSPSPRDRKRIPRPGIVAHPFIRPTLRQDAAKARTAMVEIFQDWVKR